MAVGPRLSALAHGFTRGFPTRLRNQPDPAGLVAPIKVRVVVSRYRREGKAEHGQVIDGWQYELFAALLLPPDAWPAPDVITAYFARGGQENRFAQEDRELQLDRICSYHLPGQELACLIGLMVWNLTVVHGFRLNPLPSRRHPVPARVHDVDDRPVPPGLMPVEPSTIPEPEVEPGVEPGVGSTDGSVPPQSPHDDLAAALRQLDWPRRLRRRSGWSFKSDEAELLCQAGQTMSLTSVTQDRGSKTSRLHFRTLSGICRACPLRSSCIQSANTDAIKLISTSVARTIGDEFAALLRPVQLARRREHSAEALAKPLPRGRVRRALVGEPMPVDIAAGTAPPGDDQIGGPQFLPAAARAAFRRAVATIAVRITVSKPDIEQMHPYLVTSPEQRQRRRATWAERVDWYALPEGARVEVKVHGGDALAEAFTWAAKSQGVAA